MTRRFKNIKTGHVYFNLLCDCLLRCAYTKITYTIDEAERSTDLLEIEKR